MNNRVLVFFATYNEAGNVEALIRDIAVIAPDADILVVDDNSSDGTVEKISALGFSQVHTIVRHGKYGLGTAHLLALQYARAHDYGIVVTMDGDLSHDPADLPKLIQAIGAEADLAIGSRYMPGGACDYRGYRLHVSQAANIAARCLLGQKLHEFTTSYRAFKVSALAKIDFSLLLVGGYSFFMTMMVEARSRGLLIAERPIHFRERGYGVSKIPAFEIFRGMSNLLRLAFLYRVLKVGRRPATSSLEGCESCGTAYSLISNLRKGGSICTFCGNQKV